jgi:hypothetical protein
MSLSYILDEAGMQEFGLLGNDSGAKVERYVTISWVKVED